MIRNVRNFAIIVKCWDPNIILKQRRMEGYAIINPWALLGWCWFTKVFACVSVPVFWGGDNVAVIATDSLSLINCTINMKKFAIPPVSSEVVVGYESVVGSGPPSLLHLKQNFYILCVNKRKLTGRSHNNKFARKYHPPDNQALYHNIHCPCSHKWAGPLQL